MSEAEKPKPQSSDFKQVVALLAVYSEASNRMDGLQAKINQEILDLVDAHKDEYVQCQRAMTQAETALEVYATANPEWFTQKRSVKTPYGTLKFRKSTKLEVKNEEASVLLIQGEGEKNKEFKADEYLRQSTDLDLDALGKLDDATLKKFRIVRIPDDNFKVEAATIDLGKAVREAAEKEAA